MDNDELNNSYVAEKLIPETNPLQWWASNENSYPRLTILAKILSVIPAKSVSSERNYIPIILT